MSKTDKIYHIASIICLGLHIFVFVFVLIAGFSPFHENENFYECFTGYFGENLSIYQPYFIMGLLLLSCLAALLAIKFPLISFFEGVFTFAFFTIETLPYAFEEFFVELTSSHLGSTMSTYGLGFELMNIASYIIYFDMLFFLYSFVIFIKRLNELEKNELKHVTKENT